MSKFEELSVIELAEHIDNDVNIDKVIERASRNGLTINPNVKVSDSKDDSVKVSLNYTLLNSQGFLIDEEEIISIRDVPRDKVDDIVYFFSLVIENLELKEECVK